MADAGTTMAFGESMDSHPTFVNGPYSVQMDVPSWVREKTTSDNGLIPPLFFKGLSRISQRQLPLINAFGYPSDAGKDVDIYIVDR